MPYRRAASKYYYIDIHAPRDPLTRQRPRRRISSQLESLEEASALEEFLWRTVLQFERTPTPALATILQQYRLLPTQQEPSNPERHPLSLVALACSHPSVHYEETKNPADYDRHLEYLRAFCRHQNVYTIEILRLTHVEAWLRHLKALNRAFDTRRHAIMYLRHACTMGADHGFPNVIGSKTIDRREIKKSRSDNYTLREILQIINDARDHEPENVAAFALMGLMGLRPSEVQAITPASFYVTATADQPNIAVLHTGAKTESSIRELPLPKLVRDLIRPLLQQHTSPNTLLFRTSHNRAVDHTNFAKWLAGMYRHTAVRRLPPKTLRKSFFNVLIFDLNQRESIVEMYEGRRVTSINQVSDSNYRERSHIRHLARTKDPVEQSVEVQVLSRAPF